MKTKYAIVMVLSAVMICSGCATTRPSGTEGTEAVEGLAQVDGMSGAAFEKLVRELMEAQGYEVGNLRESNDYGVDLIASKGVERIAVQSKRSKNKITRKAISEAVAGMKYYNCTRAMVVTNNEFTEDACEFGRGTECTLVDRSIRSEWLDAAGKSAE